MLMKSLFPMVAASAIVLAAGAANADVVNTYTSSSAYVAGAAALSNGTTLTQSDPVDWGIFSQDLGNSSINNSSINTPSHITTPENEMVTVTSGNGSQFLIYTNGLTSGSPASRWDGDFTSAANVLYTGGTSLTISFGSAITGIGFDLSTKASGAYSFTISAYSGGTNGTGGTLLGSVTNSGTSTGNTVDSFGTAAFAGLTDVLGDISYVVITDSGAASGSGFAIDTSLVYHYPVTAQTQTQTTPEPGTLALLGMGLVGLGFVRRRWAA